MPVLYDLREEKFCQALVRGAKPSQAKLDAGYSAKRPVKSLMDLERIQKRIAELMERAANKAVLSRTDILERVAEDWEKARSLGQMSAALKAAEMLGKETHKMFVDRKEIGSAGEFDSKSEDELREYIAKSLTELNLTPKQIAAVSEVTDLDDPPGDETADGTIN